jgi:[ribosomal protein S5]-alanine N-acetyltransferase
MAQAASGRNRCRAWLRSINPNGDVVRIDAVLLRSASTFIRPLEIADTDELLALRRRNDGFLQTFEPLKSPDFLTSDGQRREIEGAADAWAADRGYSFGVFDSDGALIGKVGLSNVARGAWQNATLGYFIDRERNGRGYGTEAVALACRFAFTAARLHRVQAAVMPRNRPSARLLVKNGFRFEGLAVNYLRINGRWEDHHVYALTIESWETGLQ